VVLAELVKPLPQGRVVAARAEGVDLRFEAVDDPWFEVVEDHTVIQGCTATRRHPCITTRGLSKGFDGTQRNSI
jgi:hypothetical protein